MTVRQLFYRLVSAAVIANTMNHYKRVSTVLTKARNDGRVDFDFIVDRSRPEYMPLVFEDAGRICGHDAQLVPEGLLAAPTESRRNLVREGQHHRLNRGASRNARRQSARGTRVSLDHQSARPRPCDYERPETHDRVLSWRPRPERSKHREGHGRADSQLWRTSSLRLAIQRGLAAFRLPPAQANLWAKSFFPSAKSLDAGAAHVGRFTTVFVLLGSRC